MDWILFTPQQTVLPNISVLSATLGIVRYFAWSLDVDLNIVLLEPTLWDGLINSKLLPCSHAYCMLLTFIICYYSLKILPQQNITKKIEPGVNKYDLYFLIYLIHVTISIIQSYIQWSLSNKNITKACITFSRIESRFMVSLQ